MNRAEQPEVAQPLRRFKPYPAYKDSGVKWLGQIPAHWDCKRLTKLPPVAHGEYIRTRFTGHSRQ